jgi:hypothetical protein
MHNGPALIGSVIQARHQAVPFTGLTFRSIHLRHFSNFGKVNALFAATGGVMGEPVHSSERSSGSLYGTRRGHGSPRRQSSFLPSGKFCGRASSASRRRLAAGPRGVNRRPRPRGANARPS